MRRKGNFSVIPVVILILVGGGCLHNGEVNKIMTTKMELSSPVFEHGGRIGRRYTCDGEDISPPLSVKGAPENTKSMALIVDDPDAPAGTWVHWLLWNIDPADLEIKEGQVPEGSTEGLNDFKKHSYGGPCPPSGTHRYFFRLYALDTNIDINENSEKNDLLNAMEGHILAKTELIGLYSRE